MASDNSDGYTLRKRLAMGMALPAGDFGIQSLASEEGSVKPSGVTLADHERAAGRPVGHNQANPNHGEFK